MTTVDYLQQWLAAGRITGEQHTQLDALVRRLRVSVFLELNALLYVGVLACAGGLTWTAQTYADRWGDLAILIPLTALVAGCLGYCFVRSPAFSPARVEPPGLAFDYILYLGCLATAVELGYVEYRFHLLQQRWDYLLLASALVYFVLAYRFDNRFVLSLAIATLGGWYGVRVARFEPTLDYGVRMAALAYGAVVALVGWGVSRVPIKPHFLETYLHIAINVTLGTLLSGVLASAGPIWLVGLLAAAAATIAGGFRIRRFAFVAYGVAYAYVGVSQQVLTEVRDAQAALSYVVISAGAVVVGLVSISRRFAREQ